MSNESIPIIGNQYRSRNRETIAIVIGVYIQSHEVKYRTHKGIFVLTIPIFGTIFYRQNGRAA